jgi:radical SAM superfamily enzyme YgiQ (UPF0313 family)
MRVLLIIPHVPLEAVYGEQSKEIGAVMPSMGIFYLASYMKTLSKHDVAILDANALKMGAEATVEYASVSNVDCVGFTATTLAYPYVVENAKLIREQLPSLKIIIGGAHAQGDPDGILTAHPGLFDFVCYGEGEYAFELLLDYLDNKIGKEELKGWKYLECGEIMVTPPAPMPDNLDVFGHPAKLLPKDWVPLYHEKILAYKRLPMFSIMGSRGCPFQCTFCTTPRKFSQLYQRRVRYHSIEWIMEELQYLQKEHGIREVNFWDDTFNIKRDRVMELCKAMIENHIDITWSCNFEANIADPEMIRKMKEAGCWSIMIGGESGSDRILKFIRKGVSAQQLMQVGKWANEIGIVSRPSFIIGLPTDTEDTINETIEFVKRADFHFPYFQLYVPLPNTEMYDQLKDHGEIVVKDPKQRSASNVNYLPNGLTEDFLLKTYRRAYRSVYLRWKMVRIHLQFIRSRQDIIRYWKGVKALLRF